GGDGHHLPRGAADQRFQQRQPAAPRGRARELVLALSPQRHDVERVRNHPERRRHRPIHAGSTTHQRRVAEAERRHQAEAGSIEKENVMPSGTPIYQIANYDQGDEGATMEFIASWSNSPKDSLVSFHAMIDPIGGPVTLPL